ncbi:MAG: marine proteobacterial sortase target protein [Candidatus Electrothrix aestuarii]|uniref:Marine proteobacterial sortase target protein n=1 Tax=Candidatus Electrothrix aestuarii TaxID=3062594 RepID=A0AAU8M0L3_9BACT|nr:marine proteobacterial sortase target protein [Candidatus Electrothrix aestuarii]
MTSEEKGRGLEAPQVDPGYVMLTVYTLGVAILVLFGWLGSANAVPNTSKQEAEIVQLLTPNEVKQGELLLPRTEPGTYRAAPMLSMDVDISVTGILARAKVKQHFTNDSDQWLEALYVFPLPDESAVDHLEMRINDRIIIGKIQKREEARQTYEKAKREGKKASLLSQLRPNIFTTAVANIGPRETVIIQIEYQQVIQRQNSVYSLRFPMVVGPRYTPNQSSIADIFSGNKGEEDQESYNLIDQKIQKIPSNTSHPPPLKTLSVIGPDEERVNPVALHVNLAAGMQLARLNSLYHGITSEKNEEDIVDINFTGEVKADRDFVLEWEAAPTQTPSLSMFSEQQGNEHYMLLMLMPPEQAQAEPLAREVIFILDTSGSMGGESISQAKKALLMAVERMRPQDRFNVIEFNSNARALFRGSRSGSQKNRAQAIDFIEELKAQGGTEIREALALALDGKERHERIRQIVFLTDGSVSNEQELFTLINNQLGDSRLFTVGIGSAPNSYFMTRAAAMGRGSYTFIGKLEEVREKMTTLFAMLEQPALTQLRLTGADDFEILPSPLPDLYQGEPLTVLMKGSSNLGKLLLSGQQGGVRPWQVTIDTTGLKERTGIAVLWARKKIRMLMDSLASGADAQQVEQEVTTLALANHLVSRYTSLIAVEEQISRPGDTEKLLENQKIQSNLPAGWVHEKVFAGGADTATSAPLSIFVGLLSLALSALLIWMQWRRQ